MSQFYKDKLPRPWLSALMVFVFWLSAMVMVALAEHAAVLDDFPMLWGSISGLLWILAALQFVHSGIKMGLLIKTFKRRLASYVSNMLGTFTSLARAPVEICKIGLYSALTVVAFILLSLLNVQSTLPFMMCFLSTLLVVVLRNFLPPVTIYLASSAPERLVLLQRMQIRSISGVTGLLDVENHLDIQQKLWSLIYNAMVVLFDSRTSTDDAWKATAACFMAMSPLIIVDARDTSAGVLFEIEEVFRQGYLPKTVFVSRNDGSCPAIERLRNEAKIPESDCSTLTEQQLVSRIGALVWSAQPLEQ